ncbi:MAG: mono/diheme cytochrome c family protein/glucose/arabinose dehydrogenase [Akkermansiaceae bacterium]|jgi:mono/diheme cytochrome c family protein/glucose/arabinose dehydrogenase
MTMLRILLLLSLFFSNPAFAQTPAKKPKKPFSPKLGAGADGDQLHPLFKLENLYPEQDVDLKISAMAFDGDDLYVTVFTPDRQNKAPFKKGEVFKVTGLIGNSDRTKVKAQRLMKGLYEPTAIAVHGGKIYLGEKDKISRLEDRDGDGFFSADEKVVLIDGLSQPNFHTYTVGFGIIEKEGQSYLAGNFTTSVRFGGSRDLNITVNPKTKRGSTFLLGPITGKEKSDDVEISYFAGGYRTPNGFALGPDQEMIVIDNQGVFNPSNEFIRLTQGAFYGHYLIKKDNTNTAAFQPEGVDSEIGGSRYQTPPTVHLPQGIVNRSPSQPVILKNLKGPLSVYNGQWIFGDVTLGRMNRVFLEEVDGVWQGAVFLHSGGHDPKGKTGFTAGPNRIIEGPDQNYYIGHIGDGGLWQFLPKKGEERKPPYGLQRLSLKRPDEIPADFNEMVALRDIPGGLEIELFKAITPDALNQVKLNLKQWTYIPTNGYGGRDFATENLTATKRVLSADGKRIKITVPGIRDNSPPFVIDKKDSNENVGWVIELKVEQLSLYKKTAWYTMLRHQGGGAQAAVAQSISAQDDPMGYAKAQFAAICAACHTLDGSRLAGPSLSGIYGTRQKVIRNGKTLEVTVDDAYLLRAINNPLAEAPVNYPPAMPNLNLSSIEQKALVEWIKTLK